MPSPLQLLLDLFDESPRPTGPAPEPATVQRPAAAPAPRAAVVPEPPRGPDPAPAAQWFRHPQANRKIRLGNAQVEYHFRRGRRRTIGFAIGTEGLVVSVPRWVPQADVDAALQQKARWITAKLDAARERAGRMDAARIDWQDGASFPFLGEDVIVVLDPRHGFQGSGAMLDTSAQALPGVPRLTLHVGLAHSAQPQQVRDAVQAWLMRQARRIFAERLDHFAPQLGVQWKRLSLSSAETTWGSARRDGSIRLNWRLVHFHMPVIDYVVAHELSHLRVMDHSPRFWETVGSVVPDFAALRGQLRDEVLPPW